MNIDKYSLFFSYLCYFVLLLLGYSASFGAINYEYKLKYIFFLILLTNLGPS